MSISVTWQNRTAYMRVNEGKTQKSKVVSKRVLEKSGEGLCMRVEVGGGRGRIPGRRAGIRSSYQFAETFVDWLRRGLELEMSILRPQHVGACGGQRSVGVVL